MGRKKQALNVGDIFSLPLPNGKFAPGQIVSQEPECMNSVLCIFFADLLPSRGAVKSFAPTTKSILSVQLITRDLLDSGKWLIEGGGVPLSVSSYIPIDEYRRSGYIGVKIRGSKIMADLVSAYHGLSLWDDYADPNYLDGLLAPGVLRPMSASLKSP